jgi:hypothetical protein
MKLDTKQTIKQTKSLVVNKNASKSDYKKSKPNYLVGNHVIE